MKTTKIEVEGGELALKNSHGDIAIIPKHLRQEVEGMIDDKCYGCLDKLISQLPRYGAKAKDGMVVKDTDLNKQGKTYEQYKSMLAEKNPYLAQEDDSIYDLRGAWQAGLEPNLVKHDDGSEVYHLGSRDPETGLLLKRESHPTFDLMIQGEKEAGYEVYESNGRQYSRLSKGAMLAEDIANNAQRRINEVEQGKKLMKDFQEAGLTTNLKARNEGEITYPSDDLRRDGVVPHNTQWMRPNLSGKTQSDLVKSDNDIIGMATPTPGLDKIGRLPGIADEIGSFVGKGIAKAVRKKQKFPELKLLDVLEKDENSEFAEMMIQADNIERKNNMINESGNEYFKQLAKPKSIARMKAFGEKYEIDLIGSFKKAEERWDNGKSILGNKRFEVAVTDEKWDGLSRSNVSLDDHILMLEYANKNGIDHPDTHDFNQKIREKSSINYLNYNSPEELLHNIVWHELSHDINKNIIRYSPLLRKELDDIFITKGTANLKDVKKAREATASMNRHKKENILAQLSNDNFLKHISDQEFDYVTDPSETWAFLSTNLRQDLKETGIINDYNDILTEPMLEKAIKNNNTVYSRFSPYIKDKKKFINLFNEMTLGVTPIMLMNNQNDKKQ